MILSDLVELSSAKDAEEEAQRDALVGGHSKVQHSLKQHIYDPSTFPCTRG